ncbi:MAG TPA: 2-C-methyl-D-erythritol 2,4-cyclodiphosphate synthase [Actinomycetota bacterium]
MTRIGIGYDVHAFVEGRPLVLGGVTIPSERGLDGHSDADVLSHAIVDAILGAAGLGDVGDHFPSDDSRWEGAASTEFLARAATMIRALSLRVERIDATVVVEAPKIAPYRTQMRSVIAETLGMDPESLNIKATTTDGVGFVGREEGAAALAVVSLTQA